MNCKVFEVVARVEFLHPIPYHHGVGKISNIINIKFVEEMALEYKKGVGSVDWCAFGAETNERQRTRYAQDLGKLQTLWKTFEGKKAVDVWAKEWPNIKVEPGTEV